MTFKKVYRKNISKEKWDNYVEKSPQGWLWHKYDLIEAVSKWSYKTDESFAICTTSNEIVAIVPLHKNHFKRKKIFPDYNYNSLGGPIINKQNYSGRVAKYISSIFYKIAKPIEIQISCMTPFIQGSLFPLTNPLLPIGIKNTLTQSYVIDLKEEEIKIWDNMESRARNIIRKAEKNEINIRKATTEEDLNIYYNLHFETYSRTGASPHSKSYFGYIWKHLLNKNLALVLFAEYKNKIIAAANFGYYKNGATYWTACSSPEALKIGANSLLQWHGIRELRKIGIRWYEVGEAFPNSLDLKEKGLNNYKKSFGGKLYPYFKGIINDN